MISRPIFFNNICVLIKKLDESGVSQMLCSVEPLEKSVAVAVLMAYND